MNQHDRESKTQTIVIGVIIIVLGAAAVRFVGLDSTSPANDKSNDSRGAESTEIQSTTVPKVASTDTGSSQGTVPTEPIIASVPPVLPTKLGSLLGDCQGGLAAINQYGGWDCRSYTIGSARFDRALANTMFDHYGEQWVEFDLGGKYVRLSLVAGVANDSEPGTKALMSIIASDSRIIWSGELERGRPQRLDNLDVRDVTILKLVADPVELGPSRHAELISVFGEPTVFSS